MGGSLVTVGWLVSGSEWRWGMREAVPPDRKERGVIRAETLSDRPSVSSWK